MLISCDCLNLGINVGSGLSDCTELDFTDSDSGESFFASNCKQYLRAAIPKGTIESARVEIISAFVDRRSLNGWVINRCLICDTDVYAASNDSFAERIIIDQRNAKTEDAIQAARKSANYSEAFKIVLPIKPGHTREDGPVLPPKLVHRVNQVLSERLCKERYELDERIQVFADAERAKFDQFKAKARQDESSLLSAMSAKFVLTNQLSSSDDDNFAGDPLAPPNPYDEPYDSGVPISPVSLRSLGGAHSPLGFNPVTFPDQFTLGSQNFATRPVAPAAKRKRHSGGKGKPPSLHDRPFYRDQTLQDVFSLDENDDGSGTMVFMDDENYAADESSDSDQFQKITSAVARVEVKDFSPSANNGMPPLCHSLPIDIASRPQSLNGLVSVGGPAIDDGAFVVGQDFDMAASMQALARGTLPQDDPQNLFGDRPGRRRFKSSAFERLPLESVPDIDAF